MSSARLSLLAFTLLALIITAVFFLGRREHWAVYYSNTLPPEAFMAYDLLVFDSDIHPPLAPLKAKGKILLGYLSIGEADTARSYYPQVKRWLLPKAPPTVIDVRRPEWKAYIVDTLVPAIVAQGFDGIMIDTADTAIHHGMGDNVVVIIKEIRARFPQLRIMLNRGFDIAPQLAGDIDMLLAESISAGWKNNSREAVPVPMEMYANYVAMLKKTKQQSRVKIYTLDYWPPGDEKNIRRIYRLQRRQGFIPYVSADPKLTTLTKEPR